MKKASISLLNQDAFSYLYCANFKDMSKVRNTHGESHGVNRTKEYRSWAGIITRCTNTRHKRYYEWGGRGISVCDRWRKYENFLSDMGRAPSTQHSIDRKENDKGYYKENCRWSTPKEQANNTRRNRIVNYNEQEYTLSELCSEFGFNYKLIAARLGSGWSIERAINEPSDLEKPIRSSASLDQIQVNTIRQLTGIRIKDVASYFKVSPMTISRVIRGVMYKKATK